MTIFIDCYDRICMIEEGADCNILLKELNEGSRTAFDLLFLRYQPKVLAFLKTCTGDEEQARDIAQDIFFNIWKDRTKLSGIRSFEGYLFQMARFSLYNYFDHLDVVKKYVEEGKKHPEGTACGPEDKLKERQVRTVIAETVRKMPQRRREIFVMSRYGGYSNDEIAERLNISKRTVENHLTAALSVLRHALKYLLCVIAPLAYFIYG